LNRVDRPNFALVRDLLEKWFDAYPADGKDALRSRFRDDNSAQHIAAFWELYLHEAYRRLGFSVQIEPAVPGATRRPDFLFEHDDDRFYLEATLVQYSDATMARRRRQDYLLDLVDSAFDADFYVRVLVAVAGERTPPRTAVVDPIEKWLAGLRWAPAWQAAKDRDWEAPQQTFNPAGSVLILEAHPKPPGLRYSGDVPMIWAGPQGGGAVDERAPVLADLRAKARAYGRPDAPYLIAVLCLRDFVSYHDIENALYGREVVQVPIATDGGSAGEPELTRDFRGLWQRGQNPLYTRVSGVLGAVHLAPWSIAQTSLRLWKNPWAAQRLEVSLPWTVVEGDLEANSLVTRDETVTPHELFNVSPDWPWPDEQVDQ
jgi:hypothetical protein